MESNFLCIPIGRRRARSRTRSEIGSIEDPSEAGQTVPRPTESTPDPRISSTSPPSGPLTPRDQDSNGMQTIFFRTIYYLTALIRATQTLPPFLIVFDLFSEEDKAAIWDPQIALLTQRQCP